MTEPNGATVAYRLGRIEDRVEKLEKLEPAVLYYEVQNLRDEVKAMKSAFNRLMGGIVLASVTFAVGVFALLGHG